MLGGASHLGAVLNHLADFVFGDAYIVHILDQIVHECGKG